MNCISWNVRGIGGCSKDVAIKKLIREASPFFVGLVETKHYLVSETKIKKLWRIDDYKWVDVKAEEGSGGLVCICSTVLFEDSCIRLGRRWVCVEGKIKDKSFNCAILVVYAPNLRSERRTLWEELLALRNEVTVPFLAMGDFNEVFSSNERRGGTGCAGSMVEFKNWAVEMCLSDLALHRRKFTWSRGNSSSRIDRMLIDADWLMKVPCLMLKALSSKLSDHNPLLLQFEKMIIFLNRLGAWMPGLHIRISEGWYSKNGGVWVRFPLLKN